MKPCRKRRHAIFTCLVIASLALVAFLTYSITTAFLSKNPASNSTATPQETYISPYNWEGLTYTNERFTYYENAVLHSQTGIDVSSHQGAIDWNAVAQDNIDFAMIRVGNRGYTEGLVYADERFADNIDGATAAGLEVGVYFFSQATTPDEAREEADFVLEQLAGRTITFPVAFDHEPVRDPAGRANHITGETLSACAKAFCERIEENGYTALIYGNRRDIARFDKNNALFENYEVWFAEYNVAYPTGQFDFIMWQYSSNGSVSGISTATDMNIRFLSE